MRRILPTLAAFALAAAVTPAALAGTPAAVRLDISVVLSGNLSASTTRGTFAASGALIDAGGEIGSGWFAGQGHLKTGEPNSLHSEMTLVGAGGSIELRLTGLFGRLPAPLAEGDGQWLVTGGTGAYADLHGQGTWRATADFRAAIAGTGPPRVSFVLLGQVH